MQESMPAEGIEGATGGFEFETHSILNSYPESIYGKASFSRRIILRAPDKVLILFL